MDIHMFPRYAVLNVFNICLKFLKVHFGVILCQLTQSVQGDHFWFGLFFYQIFYGIQADYI